MGTMPTEVMGLGYSPGAEGAHRHAPGRPCATEGYRGTGPRHRHTPNVDDRRARHSCKCRAAGPPGATSFSIGEKRFAVAFFGDGATRVLPTGAIPGLPSRPAMPGDVIALYGIRFRQRFTCTSGKLKPRCIPGPESYMLSSGGPSAGRWRDHSNVRTYGDTGNNRSHLSTPDH